MFISHLIILRIHISRYHTCHNSLNFCPNSNQQNISSVKSPVANFRVSNDITHNARAYPSPQSTQLHTSRPIPTTSAQKKNSPAAHPAITDAYTPTKKKKKKKIACTAGKFRAKVFKWFLSPRTGEPRINGIPATYTRNRWQFTCRSEACIYTCGTCDLARRPRFDTHVYISRTLPSVNTLCAERMSELGRAYTFAVV